MSDRRQGGPGGPQGYRGPPQGGAGGGGRGRGPPGRGDGGRGGGSSAGITDQLALAQLTTTLGNLALSIPRPAFSAVEYRRAKRPGYGKVGRALQIVVNHFLVELARSTVAHHYDVSIVAKEDEEGERGRPQQQAPEEEGGKNANFGQKLNMDILMKLSAMLQWKKVWVFDGRKNLYSAQLDLLPSRETTYEVTLDAEPGRRRPRKFLVATKLVATHPVADILSFCKAEAGAPGLVPRDAMQALDIALRHGVTQRPEVVGIRRSLFFETFKEPLSGMLELWWGYQQALKPCQFGLTLTVDTAVAGFLVADKMVDLYGKILNRSRDQILRGNFSDADRRTITKHIKGVRIKTTHREGQRRYLVYGLSDVPANQEVFMCDDPGVQAEITVANYFASPAVGKRLQYPQLPCIKVKAGGRLRSIPPEFCEVVPGQRRVKMDSRATSEIIKKAAQKPDKRMSDILETMGDVKLNQDPTVLAFGMKISSQLLKVDARVLPSPILSYGVPKNMDVGNTGSWNLRDAKVLMPLPLASWAVVCFISQREADVSGPLGIRSFVSELSRILIAHGIDVKVPEPPIIFLDWNVSVEGHMQQAIQAAAQHCRFAPQLLLVCLDNKETYKEVKRATDSKLGVISQCFLAEKAGVGRPSKTDRVQYCANIVLKINAKLGGVNVKLFGEPRQLFPSFAGKPFMLLGADVTHPTGRLEENSPSVAAVVASMDGHAGHYAAQVKMQTGRQELILDMKNMVKALLAEFHNRTKGRKPEAILMYRDGVSEGQFEQVLDHEYKAIRAACSEMGAADANYCPPITFVVVQKRHNTRFFPAEPNQGDRSGNVLPGTVVDRGIAHPSEFDFFLASQAAIQGTSKPAHYHVLVDENGFGADGIQLMTYWLCYTYCRCTRSVSVVPPAYYAHLAAFRGRMMVDFSDSSSEASGASGPAQFAGINAALKDSMYFV